MTDTILAFLLFAIAAGFTPGPNNLMLATSSVNFGLRRTAPHLLGVIAGFPVLFAAVGAGLGELFDRFPLLHRTLTVIGGAYLVWLAWRIAFAPASLKTEKKARPLNFWEAAAFQWVNPKGWLMTITAISLYIPPGQDYFLRLAQMTLVALLVTVASSTSWALFGVAVRRLFQQRPTALRTFNIVMGVLLLLSVIPILFNGSFTA